MNFETTPLPGALIFHQQVISDSRGFFSRQYCARETKKYLASRVWLQVNTSYSQDPGTLRGLHFQVAPFQEAKLVRCTRGAIWDVIVDLRPDSEKFGESFGVELSSSNRKALFVPEGFAHGFLTLEEESEVMYLVSEFYTSAAERTLLWSDPEISIDWPQVPKNISEKDQSGLSLEKLRTVLEGLQ